LTKIKSFVLSLNYEFLSEVIVKVQWYTNLAVTGIIIVITGIYKHILYSYIYIYLFFLFEFADLSV